MYFSLTKEQMDIQKAAREFAEGEFRAVARELDAKEMFDDRLWKKAAEIEKIIIGRKMLGNP